MKKIVSIVGARPQFVKAAILSKSLKKEFNETVIHTGQHYDHNMSDIFFKEFDFKPDINLNVGSGTHAQQTGTMMLGIESKLMELKPKMVIVYGDTNSTLAGALAAAKLHIPIAHVEAGLRSMNRKMPEEINRIMTDHASDLLFAPTMDAMNNLLAENLVSKSFFTGDVMVDAIINSKKTKIKKLPDKFYLATIHRAENTNVVNLSRVFEAFNELQVPIIFPVHPRVRPILDVIAVPDNVKLWSPVGYAKMLELIGRADKVFTDSGGIQKEAYILGTQCITLRKETEWTDTLHDNWNTLTGTNTFKIIQAAEKEPSSKTGKFFGSGDACQNICHLLKTQL